jgi:hypothetical protein
MTDQLISDLNPLFNPVRSEDLFEIQQGGSQSFKGTAAEVRTFMHTRSWNEVIFTPNTGGAVGVLGDSSIGVGTITTPTVSTTVPRCINFATDGLAGSNCGTSNNSRCYHRGSGQPWQGFRQDSFLNFPDASYNNTGASTGSRIFVGLTDQTMTTMVDSDTPTGHYAGFFRCHVNGGLTHTNWQFATRDGTTITLQDTGVPFAAASIFEFHILCNGAASTISWAIRNVTTGAIYTRNNQALTLPGATTFMRGGFCVDSVDAVVRNIALIDHRTKGFLTTTTG